MIFEFADIEVNAGTEASFERAVREAAPLFRGAKGCNGIELHRSIERPTRYTLMVSWETIEAHTVDFRSSDAFVKWRALAGPFFARPPEVHHTTRVALGV